jgi:hypothetical protein
LNRHRRVAVLSIVSRKFGFNQNSAVSEDFGGHTCVGSIPAAGELTPPAAHFIVRPRTGAGKDTGAP